MKQISINFKSLVITIKSWNMGNSIQYIFIASMLCMFFAFKLIKYINNKDSQSICDKSLFKFIICILASIENILLYIKFGLNVEYAGYFVLIVFITITAVIDYYTHSIYDIISIPMLIISLIFYITNIILKSTSIKSLLFILLIYVILKILYISKGIGEGDVDVYFIISLILARYGFISIINIILSMAVSGIASIFLLINKNVCLNYRKPLCPSIAISTYVILLLI